MTDWRECRLGDLGVVVGGGTPPRERAEYWNGSIPWLTPGELTGHSDKFVSETQDCISELGLASSGARLLSEGSLLVTSRASIGSCALAGRPMATNQGFKNVTPGTKVDPSFLFYLGRTLAKEMTRRASGTTFLEISGLEFERIKVRLPPLEEQRRIAEILDTVDDAIHATEGVIAKNVEVRTGLQSALFDGMLGSTRPVNWKPNASPPSSTSTSVASSCGTGDRRRVPAGSIVQFTRGVSWTAEQERELPSSSTHRVLRIPNIQTDLIVDDVLLVDFPGGVPDKWRATPGSIVMVGSNGNPSRVGNAVQISRRDGSFLFASFLIAARGRDQDLNDRYLFHWIRSGETQHLMSRSVHGSTGLSNLSMDFLRGLSLPLPPLEEQLRIAEILDTGDETIRANEEELVKLRELRSGVGADLLSGRVRTVAA